MSFAQRLLLYAARFFGVCAVLTGIGSRTDRIVGGKSGLCGLVSPARRDVHRRV